MMRQGPMLRQSGNVRDVVTMLGGSAPTSRLERMGVGRPALASVVPAAPASAQVNVATYNRNRGPLLNETDYLRGLYESAGVGAWSVWVPDGERTAASVLRDNGYDLMDTLPAMEMDLTGSIPERDAGLDADTGGDQATLGMINEAAWGLPAGTFTGAFRDKPVMRGPLRHPVIYRAWVGGRIVGALCTMRHRWKVGDDLGLSWLGVLPEMQGQGVGPRLIAAALNDARDAGCITATLQASRRGEPVYRMMGFREIGCFAVYQGNPEMRPS